MAPPRFGTVNGLMMIGGYYNGTLFCSSRSIAEGGFGDDPPAGLLWESVDGTVLEEGPVTMAPPGSMAMWTNGNVNKWQCEQMAMCRGCGKLGGGPITMAPPGDDGQCGQWQW